VAGKKISEIKMHTLLRRCIQKGELESDGKEKGELSFLQKIHVPQRFSTIIEADRVQAVDGERLS
jgi:hypothetical protein